MNALIDDYLTNADRFSAVVDAAGDWTAPSPCEGWTARDVVDHVVDSQRDFLSRQDLDAGSRPTGDPQRVWRAHLDGVRLSWRTTQPSRGSTTATSAGPRWPRR
ncbi:maleylpyruvate isomerase N-terminal domain-containing protein [Nocardioides ungokensis]|uniref:maleylpyruvate isomerase N-terminal domain-containing protein n=1 Tax=Nocardioides ungokensis TaxID=1643322 RepID=UPI001C609E97|nr:maleylpyruvate isomerase N-terminal domain-containing protein [Nocardioides ungokensis]